MARKRKSLERKLAEIKKDEELFRNHPRLKEDERKRLLDSLVSREKMYRHYNYSSMPQPPQKDNQNYVPKTGAWADRQEDASHMFWHTKSYRRFCKDCHHSQDKMAKCSKCGSENIVSLIPSARVPRKNASKRAWKNFIKNFVK